MVDRAELVPNYQYSIGEAIECALPYIWTALPGIIDSYDATKMTAVINPANMSKVLQSNGKILDLKLPQCLDCPVVFPGCADFAITMPLKKGDEVLIVFSKNCIDNWWDKGGIQPLAEIRVHDLSDAFCIPRVWSKPGVLSNISADNLQIRTKDGQSYVELDPAGNINLVAKNSKITVGGTSTIDIKDSFGNEIKGSATGMTLTDANGNQIQMLPGGIVNIDNGSHTAILQVNGVPVTVP